MRNDAKAGAGAIILKISEEALAKVVVDWLQKSGFEVYQEVEVFAYGNRADIVAVNEMGLSWIIETKISFGLKVMEQAYQWTDSANYISIATPRRRGILTLFERKVLRSFGIGYLMVDLPPYPAIDEILEPHLNRKLVFDNIKEHLSEEHKSFAKAGNAESSRYTPFQATCKEVRSVVEANPGIILKDLINSIRHHYSSTACARTAIAQWAKLGKIKGIKIIREGKCLKCFPNK